MPPPPQPARITVASDGRTIVIVGGLGRGSTDSFARALAEAPDVRTVALQSNGGLLVEAVGIAAIVRTRALDTYVETSCLSACAMILLAGKDRAISPRARVGFHRPYLPNGDPASAGVLRVARASYDRAGVEPGFTDRVFATPPETMWYPSYEEMLAARLVTRRTLGGETTALFSQFGSRGEIETLLRDVPMWRDLETTYPEIAKRAIDAAWAAKQQGGTDGEIMTAARLAMMGSMSQIMANASDEVLLRYMILIEDQARAAKAISVEACALLAQARLNVSQVLPKPLVEREIELLSLAIRSRQPHRLPDEKTAFKLLEPLFGTMTDAEAQAMAYPEDEHSDAARCEAAIILYSGINRMPPEPRSIVVRYILQSSP